MNTRVNRFAFIPLTLFVLLAQSACAKEPEAPTTAIAEPVKKHSAQAEKKSATQQHPLKVNFIHGEALMVGDPAKEGVVSLFAMEPVSPSVMASRIIDILKAEGASKAFVDKLEPRLKMNPRLEKDDFSLPIIDEEGNEYRFEYQSDISNRFYTLNYYSKALNGE